MTTKKEALQAFLEMEEDLEDEVRFLAQSDIDEIKNFLDLENRVKNIEEFKNIEELKKYLNDSYNTDIRLVTSEMIAEMNDKDSAWSALDDLVEIARDSYISGPYMDDELLNEVLELAEVVNNYFLELM